MAKILAATDDEMIILNSTIGRAYTYIIYQRSSQTLDIWTSLEKYATLAGHVHER